MRFGAVSTTKGLNLALPEDLEDNTTLLGRNKKGPRPSDSTTSHDKTYIEPPNKQKDTPLLYVGLPKWGQGNWVQTFYPKRYKQNQLKYYATQFNALEMNNVRYWSACDPAQLSKWLSVVPPGFRFCPKFFESITHKGSLVPKDLLTREFINVMDALKPHLGPAFLQFSDNFGPNRLDGLQKYLEPLRPHYLVALELRHPGWYAGRDLINPLRSLLTDLGIPMIMTDSPGRRDVLHQRLTTTSAFVRFAAFGTREVDYPRLEDWVSRLGAWFQAGLKEAYFFIHQPDSHDLPELAAYFIRQMNERNGFNLHVPRVNGEVEQQELFAGF